MPLQKSGLVVEDDLLQLSGSAEETTWGVALLLPQGHKETDLFRDLQWLSARDPLHSSGRIEVDPKEVVDGILPGPTAGCLDPQDQLLVRLDADPPAAPCCAVGLLHREAQAVQLTKRELLAGLPHVSRSNAHR